MYIHNFHISLLWIKKLLKVYKIAQLLLTLRTCVNNIQFLQMRVYAAWRQLRHLLLLTTVLGTPQARHSKKIYSAVFMDESWIAARMRTTTNRTIVVNARLTFERNWGKLHHIYIQFEIQTDAGLFAGVMRNWDSTQTPNWRGNSNLPRRRRRTANPWRDSTLPTKAVEAFLVR
jgi:hypothetical protein